MIINLAELRQRNHPAFVRAEFSEKQLGIHNPIQSLTRPVETDLKVTLEDEIVIVSGKIDFQMRLTCCRCARGFAVEVDKVFEAVYVPDPREIDDGDEIELEYGDLDVGFYRDDQIDITAVLSEQVVLDVPMKPICTETCKGLCSNCGADLNEGACNCKEDRTDPRLAPLEELKKRLIN